MTFSEKESPTRDTTDGQVNDELIFRPHRAAKSRDKTDGLVRLSHVTDVGD